MVEGSESHSAMGKDSNFFHLKEIFIYGLEQLEGFAPPVLHLKPYNMFLQGLVSAGSRKASFCDELMESCDLLEDAKYLFSTWMADMEKPLLITVQDHRTLKEIRCQLICSDFEPT